MPEVSIESLRLTPNLEAQALDVEIRVRGTAANVEVEVEIRSGGEYVSSSRGPAYGPLRCAVPDPILWSPRHPHLYDLQIRLVQDGRVLDEVD